ncbi:hypothetical protein [Lysinibacillus pakistanensis]|uniref:DUF4083 domain-containing protein n=1 Tax=Lysinibacillus pakistanensis TaxID=759811 RepID=A0ABX6DCD1_9BACI|nr:hypothetical protein GDS87_06665 [Lysinibacillus pakistanensis]
MDFNGYELLVFIVLMYLFYLIIKVGVKKGINDSLVGKYLKSKYGIEDNNICFSDLRELLDKIDRKADK